MPPDAHNIEVSDQQKMTVDTARVIDAARMIFSDHGFDKSELSIALVDDPEIRRLNKQYLDHDYETDVISFAIDVTDHSIVGQLIVSTDTAQRLADEINAPMEHELLLYVIHGTLHLVGLDDTDEESAQKMRLAEKEYLSRFNIEHVWETESNSSREA